MPTTWGAARYLLIDSHHYCRLSLWGNQSRPIMGSVVLPHLVTGWHVDQAIVCSQLQTSPLRPKTNLEYRCQKKTASLSSALAVTGTQTACVRMKFSTVRFSPFRTPHPSPGSLPPILSHHNTHKPSRLTPRPSPSSKKESPTESKTLQFSTYAISIKCRTSSKCTNSTTQ